MTIPKVIKAITLDDETKKQVNACVELVKQVLKDDLLAVYLYGSAIIGGLQKYSDIDLFVVSQRETTFAEKKELLKALLQISGKYMQSSKLPVELTIVVESNINPWHYPPPFDFQYGDWMREQYESGMVEPRQTKIMPDLAIIITKILLASETLYGPNPAKLLSPVPYRDFIHAITMSLATLKTELHNDTRNVLLTYARIWSTLNTNIIQSKLAAARWAIDHLPTEFKPVLERARLICIGDVDEHWYDIEALIQPCVDFMSNQISQQLLQIQLNDDVNRKISLDNTT